MAVEFRGCKNLVYAEITADNASSFTTGTVKVLAPVAEISKSVETSSEAHFYDNKASIIIDSEGEDTVTFTIAIPDDAVLADITGRKYDSTKKMFIECEREQKYFAVGYILGEKGEGDDERYVWRYKGTFNIPDETSATEDNGTGANNMSLEFKGIYTDHEFTNGKGTGTKGSAKAAFIRESAAVATAAQWFAQVSTPDTVYPATYTLSITQAAGTTVSVTRGGVALSNGAGLLAGDVLTISVTGGTITVNGSSFTSGSTHTVAANVTVVSTASE